jgi:hypothetical protein
MVINLTKLTKILVYMKKYKLKTKKLINYRRWLKVYDLVITKKHLTKLGLEKINKLKKSINN